MQYAQAYANECPTAGVSAPCEGVPGIHHKISLANAVSLRNFSATRSLARSVAFSLPRYGKDFHTKPCAKCGFFISYSLPYFYLLFMIGLNSQGCGFGSFKTLNTRCDLHRNPFRRWCISHRYARRFGRAFGVIQQVLPKASGSFVL